MNILMLGWELPPHNSGGLGVACYYLSKALALKGSKIDFILPYTAKHPDTEFMTIHPASDLTPDAKHPFFGIYDSNAFSGDDDTRGDELLEITSMRQLQRRYTRFAKQFATDNEHGIDVIHAHDWLTMEAGMAAKIACGAPLVVHVHATEFDRAGASAFGNPLVHEIEYQGLMMADRILAVSHATKRIIMKNYNIPADKIEVVHNAFDPASLDAYDYDRRTYKYLEHLKDEGYTVVATMARLTVQKGLTHLIMAAARASEKYHKLVFLIGGTGEQRDELIALAADLGISDRVVFTGFVRGKQWRDIYSIADVFVMSSVSEPFGLTALEAAHHDTALVITHQSGVSEVLNNVFKYDFWDVDKLADQLVGIATSSSLKHELIDNVKKEYARLSWNDVAEKCSAAYGVAPKVYAGAIG